MYGSPTTVDPVLAAAAIYKGAERARGGQLTDSERKKKKRKKFMKEGGGNEDGRRLQ